MNKPKEVDPLKQIVTIIEGDSVLILYYTGKDNQDVQILGDGCAVVTIPESMLLSVAIHLLKHIRKEL